MTSTFICVAGNMGSGKSTLVRLLAARHGWTRFDEPVDGNPYLEGRWKDPRAFALKLQLFYLERRREAHLAMQAGEGIAIQDRSVYEGGEVFVPSLVEDGVLTAEEAEAYRSEYERALHGLEPPSLIVYLRRSVEGLLEQVAQRGREYEARVSPKFLESVNRRYEDWFARWPGRKVALEGDSLDFVAREADLQHVDRTVLEALAGDA